MATWDGIGYGPGPATPVDPLNPGRQPDPSKPDRLAVMAERAALYGPPGPAMTEIGRIWSSILSTAAGHPVEVTGHQVALMMAGLKLARAARGGPQPDTYVDLHNYADIAEVLAQPEAPKLKPASATHEDWCERCGHFTRRRPEEYGIGTCDCGGWSSCTWSGSEGGPTRFTPREDRA